MCENLQVAIPRLRRQELGVKIYLHKALLMALIHDVCEIDAEDTPAFGPQRPDQHEALARESSHFWAL